MIPNVETAEQLRELIAYTRYPPEGVRGIGAERATAWGEAIPQHVQETFRCAPLCIALLETHTAHTNREVPTPPPSHPPFNFHI